MCLFALTTLVLQMPQRSQTHVGMFIICRSLLQPSLPRNNKVLHCFNKNLILILCEPLLFQHNLSTSVQQHLLPTLTSTEQSMELSHYQLYCKPSHISNSFSTHSLHVCTTTTLSLHFLSLQRSSILFMYSLTTTPFTPYNFSSAVALYPTTEGPYKAFMNKRTQVGRTERSFAPACRA